MFEFCNNEDMKKLFIFSSTSSYALQEISNRKTYQKILPLSEFVHVLFRKIS